jgi:hypothetical protein
MAAVTPFGESFGDPRRYMGQSPLAQVGQAAKLGLVLTGLHKSGAIKALDNIGVKLDNKGGFSFNAPAGAVAPTTPPIGPQPVVPTQAGVAPVLPTTAPAAAPGVQITPLGQDAPSNVQINTLAPPPPDAGMQLLNNTFKPQSSVDVKNETDFNPLAPDASNQFAVSGNDYQQIPGFGKLQKIAGQLLGMG